MCRKLVAMAGLSVVLSLPWNRASAQTTSNVERQVTELRALVMKLQARVDSLEAQVAAARAPVEPPAPQTTTSPSLQNAAQNAAPAAAPAPAAGPLAGTTVNLTLDGYYSYNFNAPIGRVNRLRAYDVSSNSFSLNQAAVILENAPDPASGKRFGARLDLQFGQATQTLQGNPANELRPEIYRDIFQAYGTYVAPLGKGLTIDFGKWASALGIENNYSKDQANYSRSYFFNYLPFYHMGVRLNYKVSDVLSLAYWVTNGAQSTEAFNGFKGQLVEAVLQPNKNLSWTLNYFVDQPGPDVVYYPYGAPAGGFPTQQGVPFAPVFPKPNGHQHIFDSYLSWQASPRLSFGLEGDYVVSRYFTYSPPFRVTGGAAYSRYQLTPKFALAARAEYLSDRGGLFSGATQALKETTFTTEYKLADGFLVRGEWRRDFSNHPYFYTDASGILKKEQNTATLGLVWWFGPKQGAW